jgi:hypothetical protein
MAKATTTRQQKAAAGKGKAPTPRVQANGHHANGLQVDGVAGVAAAMAGVGGGSPPAAKPAAPGGAVVPPDPKYTVVIVGDKGIYKLTRDDWEQGPYKQTDPALTGVVTQLNEFGALVSYIPDDLAVGFGIECLVINLDALLRGNVNKNTVTPGSAKAPVNGGKSK